jgi:hypothetical protein
MCVLGAAAARAESPLDSFARLLQSAGNGLAREMSRPAPRRADDTPVTVPKPNLRPGDATAALAGDGAARLPPNTAAFADVPPKAAATAPFNAVAPVVPLSSLPQAATAKPTAAAPATPPVQVRATPDAVTPAVAPRPTTAPVLSASLSPAATAFPARPPATPATAYTGQKPGAPVVTASLPPGWTAVPAAPPKPAEAPKAPAPSAPAAVAAIPPAPPAAPLPTPSPLPKVPSEATTACAVALAAFGVKAKAAPGLGEGECRVAAPVTITNAGDIAVMPKALINCGTAATLAAWLQDTVAPKAEEILGAKLTAVRVLDTYNCRTVDNIKGANLSEHAHGEAVDIGAFKIGERWITVGAKDMPEADVKFLAAVRSSACGPFTTVLGPGTDSYHSNHFHLDVKMRQTAGPGGGAYCH